ncbi:hypothetical protein ACP70R_038985 [Stipagrostis hirtigluma subsp. patula]
MADEGASSRPELIEPTPASPMPAPAPVTARKPRGRPPGSKNKPKPPVIVTRESETAMRSVVLELAAGCDVATAVAAFARRRRVGVSVLCGRGAVAAVTLRLATSPATASTVTLHGRFEVLALSGTVLPPAAADDAGAVPPPFSVSLAGAGGQVIGGTLAGDMTAADGMVVVAATFGSAEVHRLPAAEAENEASDGRGGREERRHLPPPPQQQQQMVMAVNVGDVGPFGYGGALGLGGGPVGQQQQQLEMALWAQPSSIRGPVHPSTHF